MRFTLRKLFAAIAAIAVAVALLLALTAEYRRQLAIRSDLQKIGAHDVSFSADNTIRAWFQVPVASPAIARYRGELTVLEFKGAHITDESLEHASGLEEVNVMLFNLSDLRDDQVRLFKRFRKVRGLWLSHTKLTDACIDALVEVPGLEWVKLDHSQITASGIERLRMARPQLVVHNPWSRPEERSAKSPVQRTDRPVAPASSRGR
jgi:hypothetical protein